MVEALASSVTEEGWALKREGRKPEGGSASRAGRPLFAEGEREPLLAATLRTGREARGRQRRAPRPQPTRFQYFAERHAAPNRSFPG